jgi:hypothetical protein
LFGALVLSSINAVYRKGKKLKVTGFEWYCRTRPSHVGDDNEGDQYLFRGSRFSPHAVCPPSAVYHHYRKSCYLPYSPVVVLLQPLLLHPSDAFQQFPKP